MALLDELFFSSNEGSLGFRNDESSGHSKMDRAISKTMVSGSRDTYEVLVIFVNDLKRQMIVVVEALKKGLDVQVVYDQRFITLTAYRYFSGQSDMLSGPKPLNVVVCLLRGSRIAKRKNQQSTLLRQREKKLVFVSDWFKDEKVDIEIDRTTESNFIYAELLEFLELQIRRLNGNLR